MGLIITEKCQFESDSIIVTVCRCWTESKKGGPTIGGVLALHTSSALPPIMQAFAGDELSAIFLQRV